MVKEGYFIRGGVTIGDIRVEESTVFGPAIVKAYRLESEFAVYPRVVIDPLVFEEFETSELLRSRGHTIEEDRRFLSELVRRDSDGLYFINYLRAILDNLEEGEEPEFLLTHKQRILESASDHTGLNKIAAKLLWAATYHNLVISELHEDFLRHFGVQREDLVIDHEEMNLIYTLG
jgi:hypothetical protein